MSGVLFVFVFVFWGVWLFFRVFLLLVSVGFLCGFFWFVIVIKNALKC